MRCPAEAGCFFSLQAPLHRLKRCVFRCSGCHDKTPWLPVFEEGASRPACKISSTIYFGTGRSKYLRMLRLSLISGSMAASPLPFYANTADGTSHLCCSTFSNFSRFSIGLI